MLNEYQQKIVWEGLLGSEIRTEYFAQLSQTYQRRQRLVVIGNLVFSSGAFLTLVTSAVPAAYAWVRPVLALAAAVLSLWSLVAKNERTSIDAADLHYRWNMLAIEYRRLWSDVYSSLAHETLAELEKREADISKSSTAFPNKREIMEKCQDHVVMHHRQELTA